MDDRMFREFNSGNMVHFNLDKLSTKRDRVRVSEVDINFPLQKIWITGILFKYKNLLMPKSIYLIPNNALNFN
jgi:hypothetical protein